MGELRESFESQISGAENLRAIASAPSDAVQALDMIARKAVRIFAAVSALLRRLDESVLRAVGSAGLAASNIGDLLLEETIERGICCSPLRTGHGLL